MGERQWGYLTLTPFDSFSSSHVFRFFRTRTSSSNNSSTLLSWGDARPPFLSAVAGQEQGQFSPVQKLVSIRANSADLSSLLLVVRGATDINTDYSCGRGIDLDMAPGGSTGYSLLNSPGRGSILRL